MRLLGGGRVYLEKGETIPAFCQCGHVYQPEKHSPNSRCPKCGRWNKHSDMGVREVEKSEHN